MFMIHNNSAACWRAVAFLVLLILNLSGPGGLLAADGLVSNAALLTIKNSELRKHVSVLASDTFEGREAGTAGGRASGAYIVDRLKKLGAQPAADQGYFQEFGYGYRNILCRLPGSDPKLKQNVILVGAHYDHVGYGNQRNSRGPIGQIHNGADDNASGTAGLLEIIEAFRSMDRAPKRTVLFAFWDAEEKGLLGSEHWVQYPTVALSRIRLTINTDMIGRVRDRRLIIWGTRTAPGLRRFVSEQNHGALTVTFPWEVRRDSDHYPFYTRSIPFLMLHSGKHEEYHRPTDDPETLNFQGLEEASRLLFRLVRQAADAPKLPQFRGDAFEETKAVRIQAERSLPRPSPRLGIAWDHSSPDTVSRPAKGIVEITSVVAGSPAERADLRAGDQIIEFAGHPTKNFQDFRTLVLTARNPVAVKVRRDKSDELVLLNVKLDGEPTRLGIAWRVDDAEPNCVILNQVIPGSPAGVSGLKVNDRVYSVNDMAVASSRTFFEMVTQGNGSLNLRIGRAGSLKKVIVNLVPRIKMPQAASQKSP